MKSRFAAPFLVVMLIFTACGDNDPKTVALGFSRAPLQEASPNDNPGKRLQLFETWLSSAQTVADQSHDPEAMQLVKLVRQHARLGYPVPDGYVILATPRDHRFDVMQLLQQDTNLSPVFTAVSQTIGVVATFETNWKSIILGDNQPYTQLWQGVVLIHEAKHALQSIQSGWDPISRDAATKREIEAHQMIGRILKGLDPVYPQVIESEKARLHQGLLEGNLPDGEKADISALDTRFGAATTLNEQKIRRVQVWIEGGLALLQDLHGDAAQAHQIAFLNRIYGR